MNAKILRWALVLVVSLCMLPLVIAQDAQPTATIDDTIEIDLSETGESIENAAGQAVEATENIAEATLSAVDQLLIRLSTVPNNTVLQVVLVIIGAVLLVFGWRIYDEIILLAGAFIGAAIGLNLVGDGGVVLEVAAFLIGGLLGLIFAIFFYFIAMFFIGAYIGLILTVALFNLLGVAVSSLVLLIGAIVGGLLILALSTQLMIILSAIIGAQMIVLGLGLTGEWLLILAIVGMVIQFIAIRAMNIDLRRRPRRNYRRMLLRR
ncbi:MAG: hypothetical protein CL607_03255 [Anaerolineaceae bacterium]|nr:hypothetical protein [Anaerolineaceae bacterium]